MGLWEKGVNLFFDWAKQKKRWPLALPLSIPFVFPFFQKYYELEFAETVNHWSFLIFGGCAVAISGMLYWLLERSEGHRFLTFLSMLLAGLAFMSGGVWQLIPKPPPHDKFVVCIARFTSPSPDDYKLAADCQQYMDSHLRKRQREDVPILVNRVETQIIGVNEDVRKKVAVSLGKTTESASHVVLWGDILSEAEGIFIEPRLTFANPIKGFYLKEGTPLQLLQMGHFHFERFACQDVADVALVVYGLAFLNSGSMDKALEIIQDCKSATGYYFQSMLYLLNKNYIKGVEALKKSLKMKSDNIDALNNLAVVYFFLGRSENAKIQLEKALDIDPDNLTLLHNFGLLQMIMKDYEGASKIYNEILKKKDDFESRLNRAFCLFEIDQIDQAVRDWEQAYDHCSKLINSAQFKASCLDVKAGLAVGVFASGDKKRAFKLYSEVIHINKDYLSINLMKNNYFWPEKSRQIAQEIINNIKNN